MTTSGRGGLLVRLVAVVSLAVGGVGCEPSKIDPNAAVSISGRVTTQSGEPLAGRPMASPTKAVVGLPFTGSP
ncbi:MAG: hypothetical protein M3134_08965 [Actinomycetota bacterium]|nr:hypothetical protein [Actinomycetota bacterium]